MNWIIHRTARLESGMDAAARHSPIFPLAYPGDNEGHTWQVAITQDGDPVDLSEASIVGYFYRVHDAETVMAVATIEGNIASVVLPQQVYAYSDDVIGIMRITADSQIFTADSIRFRIGQNLTEEIIDPGEVIPSIDDLLAQIHAMEVATAAANAAAAAATAAAQHSVRYDEAQTLTDAEKAQARANISVDAISISSTTLVIGG